MLDGIKRGERISYGGLFSPGSFESIRVQGINFSFGASYTIKPLSLIGFGVHAKVIVNPVVQGFSIGSSLSLGQIR